jgi:YD repeat-containing protein
MTVAGQPSLTYGYDSADRLTSLTQGSAAVTIAYDDAGRRTSLTVSNGVVTVYGYTSTNQLTSLTFTQGATTLGTLTYSSDADGNRTAVGGTWARSLRVRREGMRGVGQPGRVHAGALLTGWAECSRAAALASGTIPAQTRTRTLTAPGQALARAGAQRRPAGHAARRSG